MGAEPPSPPPTAAAAAPAAGDGVGGSGWSGSELSLARVASSYRSVRCPSEAAAAWAAAPMEGGGGGPMASEPAAAVPAAASRPVSTTRRLPALDAWTSRMASRSPESSWPTAACRGHVDTAGGGGAAPVPAAGVGISSTHAPPTEAARGGSVPPGRAVGSMAQSGVRRPTASESPLAGRWACPSRELMEACRRSSCASS